MRKLVPAFALLLLAGCTKNVTAPVPDHPKVVDWTISATWNYDFTNFVPCPASVTVGCVTGFTWGYIQKGVQVPLKTSPASVCTGTTQPEACSDSTNALLGIGTVQYYIVANGFDNSGTPLSSLPDNGNTDTIAIGLATNLAVTRK